MCGQCQESVRPRIDARLKQRGWHLGLATVEFGADGVEGWPTSFRMLFYYYGPLQESREFTS